MSGPRRDLHRAPLIAYSQPRPSAITHAPQRRSHEVRPAYPHGYHHLPLRGRDPHAREHDRPILRPRIAPVGRERVERNARAREAEAEGARPVVDVCEAYEEGRVGLQGEVGREGHEGVCRRAR